MIWTGTLAFCAWWLVAETSVQSDLTSFLPRASSPAERLLFEELREGPAARLILISIEGGSEADKAAASAALAEGLRGSRLFVRVANGTHDVGAEEREKLFAYRYLLAPDSDPRMFEKEGLRAALERRLRELRGPESTFSKHLLAEDPTASLLAYAAVLHDESGPRKRRGVWFSEQGTRALLLAETRSQGFDLDAQGRTLAHIYDTFSTIAPDEALSLTLSGPAVFAVESRRIIKRQSNHLGLAALVGIATILYLAYRSLPLLLVGALPIATALAAGTAAVSLFYGGIHSVGLAFGMTLLGITLDYPIHLFSHAREGESAAAGLMRIWPTLRLSAATTCVGFLALVASGFSGLSQVGTLAAAGILAAALATRWVLPGLLALVGFPGLPDSDPYRWRILLAPGRKARTTGVFAAALGLFSLATFGPPAWEEDLASLSPVPERLIARDSDLRAQLKAPDVNSVILIAADDPEEALQRAEALDPLLQGLVADGVVGGYQNPSRVLPSRRTQLARREMLPDARTLHANLTQARSGLPFKQDFFAPFEDAVSKTRTLPPLEPLDLEGTAAGLKIASLLFPAAGGGWLVIVPLSGIANLNELASRIEAEAPPRTYFLDTKRETERILTSLRTGAFERLGFGSVLIAAMLAVALRSIGLALRVLLPVVAALILDLSILSLIGERLSLFHLISLLLVIGISLDYSLFFGRGGDSAGTRLRTLHALTICASSTVCVFGLLSLSGIPVLDAMGKTVAIGVLCGYLMAFAFSRPVAAARL